MVYEAVRLSIPSMLKPNMTASWEMGLSMVEKGELTDSDYEKKLYDYVRKYTEFVKEKDISGPLRHNIEIVKKVNK